MQAMQTEHLLTGRLKTSCSTTGTSFRGQLESRHTLLVRKARAGRFLTPVMTHHIQADHSAGRRKACLAFFSQPTDQHASQERGPDPDPFLRTVTGQLYRVAHGVTTDWHPIMTHCQLKRSLLHGDFLSVRGARSLILASLPTQATNALRNAPDWATYTLLARSSGQRVA